MNPFAPPAQQGDGPVGRDESRVDPATLDRLLDEARVPRALKFAAAGMGWAGALVLLTGIQNVTLVRWMGAWMAGPIAMVVLGALGIAVAARLARGRGPAPVIVAAAALLTAGSIVFFSLAVLSGLFGLLGLMCCFVTALGLVLCIVAIGPFRLMAAARERLLAAGYDLNL